MTTEPTIVVRRDGRVGRILMNRPKALNALTLDMIRVCDSILHEWKDDPHVHAVVIEGAGERAFCAGSDLKHIVKAHAQQCFQNLRSVLGQHAVDATGCRVDYPVDGPWVERVWHELHRAKEGDGPRSYINSGNFAVRRESQRSVGSSAEASRRRR